MITVLIPTHGRPTLLERTLKSLVQCAIPQSYRELIVVENGSRDGAAALVEGMPPEWKARYLHYPTGNKSEALNFALEKMDGDELVVYFDDDIRLSPAILTAYEQAARATPSDAFFAGPTSVDYEDPPPEWLKEFLPKSAVGWTSNDEELRERPGALGFNWAVYADCVRRLGGFDGTRGPGGTSGGTGQEADMQHRLTEAGVFGRYVPEALVWHYVPCERCTPEWCLNRAFRNGITRWRDGQPVNRNGTAGPWWQTQRGLWLIKKYCFTQIRAIYSSLTQDAETAFRCRWWHAYYRGMLAGTRSAGTGISSSP